MLHVLEIITVHNLVLNETAVDPTLKVCLAVSDFISKDGSSISI
jgi:hypothetical protein